MRKSKLNYFLAAIGIVLLGLGLYLCKAIADPQGFMKALPYVLIGLGCGAFGNGLGNIVSNRTITNDPKLKKEMEINEKDERNIAISHRAKAKAFDMMTFVYGALLVAFALMQVEVTAVLLATAAYLFVQGYGIYCRFRYEKEM